MARTVRENGVTGDYTEEQICDLLEKGMIYWCPDCKVYHIDVTYTFDDLDKAVRQTVH